ncbi:MULTISPECIES: hypothetical protein [unclassified Streptomyces]|uniref:Uncharacterized protein n=1 Tax=Streptomyces evansiae TaxID=3075535 RepID=A0ABU2RA35_9ACTN|nr:MULTISPECIES: hypothetical protein [unclassified Streptomyces]MYQ57163.1 hypothetical protein [Streptomyces sp. SID4926]MYR29300.1 hypothetical protein [Streptomyces sp. SID4945]ASY36133.1 hypothetical protein CAC01_28430 [Streptomyces sp. CLI2509]EGJ78907.1 hypothetical protein STTU_6118 [Streptomyces sp. Tu6071]MDT0413561.1 hypothetical protein [Streptomyces sp. DSM 41979]
MVTVRDRTDERRARAARACLRLRQATRAVLADPRTAPAAAVLLAGPMAEADAALREAGLAGNEAELCALLGVRA